MDYDKLKYYQFNITLAEAIKELEIGTEYIIVWNNDSITHLGFKADSDIGSAVTYNDNTVIRSHIDWWKKHPDTFPEWQTKEGR